MSIPKTVTPGLKETVTFKMNVTQSKKIPVAKSEILERSCGCSPGVNKTHSCVCTKPSCWSTPVLAWVPSHPGSAELEFCLSFRGTMTQMSHTPGNILWSAVPHHPGHASIRVHQKLRPHHDMTMWWARQPWSSPPGPPPAPFLTPPGNPRQITRPFFLSLGFPLVKNGF